MQIIVVIYPNLRNLSIDTKIISIIFYGHFTKGLNNAFITAPFFK